MVAANKSEATLLICQGHLTRYLPPGVKARGIASLPVGWVPPFAALTVDFIQEWRRVGAAARVAGVDWPGLVKDLAGSGRYLLVRSDGPAETQVPGAGSSATVPASPSALTAALDEALTRAERRHELALPLVQAVVEPALLGVMSNERRLARRRDHWLVEGALRLRSRERRTIRAARETIGNEALSAFSPRELLAGLRIIAARLPSGRSRCEWIWDGTRIWVVQADRVENTETPSDVQQYLGHRSRRVPMWHQTARPPTDVGLEKLASYNSFLELGWPTVPLETVRASEIASQKASVRWCNWLTHERFPRELLVVRTDLVGADDVDGVLLPTSKPLQSSEQMRRFLEQTRKELAPLNKEPAFLVSPLVPARASAMARAVPAEATVEIDALWGFPDGLLTAPHDTYRESGDGQLEMHTRFKPGCLILDERSRRFVPLGEPWDWSAVLRRDEIAQIAEWARQLAERDQIPIQLMALARIGGARGMKACLPFHFMRGGDDPATKTTRVAPPERGRIVVLRDRADLRGAESEDASGYKLEPDVEHLRDTSFLRAVGALAHQRRKPIFFAGSSLGHVYYILRRAGAVVVSAQDPDTQPDADSRAVVVSRRCYPDRVYSLRRSEMERLGATQQRRGPSTRFASPTRGSAFEDLPRVEIAATDSATSPDDWLVDGVSMPPT